ncbi:MAG: hypothetical protein ACRYFW_16430 [Janthinobacterium lividum]
MDPGEALLHALLASAPDAAGAGLVAMTSVAWASATFVGARHTIRLAVADHGALAGWLADLPEAPLPLRGHLLVDAVVRSVERREAAADVVIEALTIEDVR